jgi:acyl carrier protein
MKHDPETIKENLKTYIQQATNVDIGKIQFDSLFFKEGYLDSMGFIMLITYIEEEFEFKTSDDDLIEENFESINAISDYIIRKVR